MQPVRAPLQGADRLEFLYRISNALDLEQVLNTVMDQVIEATRAERELAEQFGRDLRTLDQTLAEFGGAVHYDGITVVVIKRL